jgi:Uma2 family endonuclease
MALPAQKLDTRVSIAEYLRREEASEIRHEFHDGEVLAMSGGTFDHAAVATNLVVALGMRLRGQPCRVLDSNMRVAVQRSRRFVYPEASILCQPPQFHPDDPKRTTIVNPRVIFEVLSDSTESYDRGEKFEKYRQIGSLDEYVLLAQDRPTVEGFLRQPDGAWGLLAWNGLDAVARLRCLGLDLPLSELYAGVELSERPTPEL